MPSFVFIAPTSFVLCLLLPFVALSCDLLHLFSRR